MSNETEFRAGMDDFAGAGSEAPGALVESEIEACGLNMEKLATACKVDDARVRAALPQGEPITRELVLTVANRLWEADILALMTAPAPAAETLRAALESATNAIERLAAGLPTDTASTLATLRAALALALADEVQL